MLVFRVKFKNGGFVDLHPDRLGTIEDLFEFNDREVFWAGWIRIFD